MNQKKQKTTPSAGIAAFGFRMGLALAVAGQGMVFGLGYNLAMKSGDAPAYGSVPYVLIHGLLFLSAIFVMLLLGGPLWDELKSSLMRGKLQVEALFSLSLGGALVGSVISSLRGEGSVYYEIVAIVLAIYSLGKQLSAQKRSEAFAAIEQMGKQYEFAMRYSKSGNHEAVPVKSIQSGEYAWIESGSFITVDGIITSGEGYVLESAINGEPIPQKRKTGDRLISGMRSIDGGFKVRVDQEFGNRYIDKVFESIRTAGWGDSRLQHQADRLMRFFVPLVCTVSLLTFGVGVTLFGLPWADALFRAMSVLLIVCPCALGIALPIGLWSGLYRLSEKGIIAHSASFIDRLATVDTLVFDKTGTLSSPEIKVIDFHLFDDLPADLDEQYIRNIVASLEAGVDHPIAKAIGREGKACLKTEARSHLSNMGLQGRVDGHDCLIDSWEVGVDGSLLNDVLREHKKLLRVRIGGRTVAAIGLGEIWRPESIELLKEFSQSGYEVTILTGDPKPSLPFEAEELTVLFGLSSSAKRDYVQGRIDQGKRLLYIGDGINDAESMQAATISLAMGDGSSFVQSVASATIVGASLEPLRRSLLLAKRILKMIQSNFIYALTYNSLGMLLAVTGYLHPVAAALVMLVSSLFVSIRTIRCVEAF